MRGSKFEVLRRAAVVAASALALLTSHSALAQYPEKPITLIVPFSPGGATDLAGRNLAQHAGQLLGQTVIVLNRPGAAGIIGSEIVRKAAPDGYTLLLARVATHAVGPAIEPTVTPYKWNDFTFLSLLEMNPTMCVASISAPYKSLPELAAHLKQNPGKLNYSSSGQGSMPFMMTQLFLSLAGLPSDIAVNVPYKSDAESIIAMLGGQIDFHCAGASALLPQLKAGKVRGLVVAMPQRWEEVPDVPTAREVGFPDLEKVVGWSALYGPPGLPSAVVSKWAEVMKKLAANSSWIAANHSFGGIPSVRSPTETEHFAREQFELYQGLGKQLGIIR